MTKKSARGTLRIVAVLVGCVGLLGAACAKKAPPTETAADVASEPTAKTDQTFQLGQDGGDGNCAMQTVFFEYDDDSLDPRSRENLSTAVTCYTKTGFPARIRLTGAADPRGTEEYNLALGERRAQAVRTYLVALGVDGNLLSVASVGKEAATGTDEEGWRNDRKVSVSEE